MALSTADLRSQEDADRVVDVGQRHAVIAQLKSDRGVLPGLAIGGQHFVDPLVVLLVGANRFFDVAEVRVGDKVGLRSFDQSQRVGPEVVEVANVIGAIEEHVDQFLSLIGCRRFQIARGFLKRGDSTGDVQDRRGEERSRRRRSDWARRFGQAVSSRRDHPGESPRSRPGPG